MVRLAIKAGGLVTPVGFNAPATCAALRAGIRNVQVANLWDAESGQYIAAGRVPLPQWWEGPGKLPELVAPAILECLQAATPITPRELPLLLGVSPSTRPHRWAGLDDWILKAVEEKLGVQFHPSSQVIPRGQVAGVWGAREAARLIEEEGRPGCIVAGVESYLQQPIVQAYMNHRRVLTPGNSNGFSPGEAGSAVLLAACAEPPADDICILGTGVATEPATIESEEPLRGEGLTEAIRLALAEANVSMPDTHFRITDLNGEHYKFKEATLAFNRLLRSRIESHDIWHPIEYIGEIGAAIGPLVLAFARDAIHKGYAPGSVVICHFSNDDQERAAAVVGIRPGGQP